MNWRATRQQNRVNFLASIIWFTVAFEADQKRPLLSYLNICVSVDDHQPGGAVTLQDGEPEWSKSDFGIDADA